MIQYDFIAVIVYSLGFILWFPLWHFLVGYSLLGKMKLLYIAFLGAPFVFLTNIVLAFFSTINEYSLELDLYPYVEGNAKTVAVLSLAIAVFVVLRIGGKQLDESKPRIKLFLWLILWAFLISALGTIPLYWVPSGMYWLTVLRHIKGVPLFYSIFILAAGIIVFLYDTGFKRNTIQEIEEDKIYD
jgi:hypothetical protein